ncbi:MAG TPA: hypothetical protein VF630_07175, partial [Hymenobacter sp.]
MHKSLLLTGVAALLAGPVAAQTEPTAPAPTPPPAKEEKSPWMVFDQPLDSLPATNKRARAVRERAAAAPPISAASASKTTQGANYVPLDPDTYRLIDRYAIKFGPDSLNDPHTSVRPYTRAAVARLGERMLSPDSATARTGTLSRADRFNAEYLLKDNWMNSGQGAALNESPTPVLQYFYRNQTDLYSVQTKDFLLRVNPVLLLQAGKDSDISGLRYVNTRGVQLEGLIDQKLGFYTFLADNQQAVPQYVQDR